MTIDHRPTNGPDVEPPPHPEDGTPVAHDPNAERYVLGAALLDPQQIPIISRALTPSDFWNPRHETIWRAIQQLHTAEQPTQPQAVAAHLVDTGQTAGGPLYLFELIENCANPASADYYARRIEQLSRRRTATTTVRRSLQRLLTPGPDSDVDHVLNTITDELLQARDDLANPAPPSTWAPVDLDGVLKGEYLDPPPTMLLRSDGVPLLYDGAIHTISGESESGKTWLTLLAAQQLLAEQQNVRFIDFEDRADRVIGRLLALGATPQQIRDHFDYIRPDRPLDNDGQTALQPHLVGVRLVILDGVTEAMGIHGYDLNSNSDVALFYDRLPRWIADHGPAVVMIDHVVKDTEKQGRFAIGGQHKLAGIDGVGYVVKMLQPFARGKRGLARVNVAKDRAGHVRERTIGKDNIAEFTLDATRGDGSTILLAQLDPPGEQTGRVGDHFEPTVVMERISRYVQANPGMSKKSIETVQNTKVTTSRLALDLLVSRGYIGTKSGRRGAIEHFHIKPYYADGDPDTGDTEPTEDDPWKDVK